MSSGTYKPSKPIWRSTAQRPGTSDASAKKPWVIALVIMLVVAGSASAYYYFRADPVIALANDLRAKMSDESLSRDERREAFGQFREQMEKMTPEQRQKLFDNSMREFGNRGQKEIDEYFALPKEQRVALLDKRINEGEKRRKDWEKRRKEREQQRAREQAAGGTAGAGAQTGGGGGPGGGGDGRGRGWGGPASEADRNAMRRKMLDNTTPDDRAKRTEYMRAMEERRKERGLPPIRPRWG